MLKMVEFQTYIRHVRSESIFDTTITGDKTIKIMTNNKRLLHFVRRDCGYQKGAFLPVKRHNQLNLRTGRTWRYCINAEKTPL